VLNIPHTFKSSVAQQSAEPSYQSEQLLGK
jgi:hypothetical protein